MKNTAEKYIIVKNVEEDKVLVWQAPRGLLADKPEERWSYNPYSANVYEKKSYAESAIERLKEASPREFEGAYVTTLEETAAKFSRRNYYSLSDLLTYYPKSKRAYILEGKQMFFFASQEDRENYKRDKHLDGIEYDIKII